MRSKVICNHRSSALGFILVDGAKRRGDLVWLDFIPEAGHEQSGRRPAIILSPEPYNSKTGLAIACPITNQWKGYPFEVALPSDQPVTGLVLSDHVRSIDWRARRTERVGQADDSVINEVLGKLAALLGD
jgi:mRNA interferase MazF